MGGRAPRSSGRPRAGPGGRAPPRRGPGTLSPQLRGRGVLSARQGPALPLLALLPSPGLCRVPREASLGGEKVRGWVGTPGPRPRAAPLTALSLSLLRLESGPPAPRPRAPGGKRARRRGSWERSCRAEPCSRPHFPRRHLVPGEEDGDGQVAFQQPVAPGLAAPLQLHPAPPAGHRRAQW